MFKASALSLLLGLSLQASAKPAVINTFIPQNLTETVNQIKVMFSEKMVNLSVDPSAAIFDITCAPALQGTARWQDEQSWTFDFQTKLYANKLPGGTRCDVKLKPDVKTLKGAAITGKKSFTFEIDGPNIISLYPGDANGRSSYTVSEDQVFALGLDASVDVNSVIANAYFKVEGRSPIQIRVLPEAEKRALMKAENFPSYMFNEELPILMIQGKEKFPSNKKVSFVWGPGIKSQESGLARRRTLVLPFESRALLTAEFKCDRENANADCSPFSAMTVQFNAEISASYASQIKLISKDGTVYQAEVEKGASQVSQVRFPALIKEKQTFRLEMPLGVKDDAGRPLSNQSSFPLVVKTAPFPPLAKFAADFGIIEASVKPTLLPATLRYLETKNIPGGKTAVTGKSLRVSGDNFANVVAWLKHLDIKSQKARSLERRDVSVFAMLREKTQEFEIPVQNKGKDFEVVGIPLNGPGFYVVELNSKVLGRSLLGKDTTMYVPTGALVTNMVAHVKWGRDNSIFWVTALDSGTPVAGATVGIHDCAGKQVHTLTTGSDGIARLSNDLKKMLDLYSCSQNKNEEDPYSKYDSGFFITAKKGNDFTFSHSGWNEGLETWRYGNVLDFGPEGGNGEILAHSILDRTLVRAGETVSMKHILRLPTIAGIKMMSAADLPNQAWIENSDTQNKYTVDLKWDASGTAAHQLTLPKEAKLGLYTISLVKTNGTEVVQSYSTASFQVMEFKVPQMKGTIAFPTQTTKLIQPGSVEAQISVNYQDGGPAAGKNAVFRYTIDKSWGLYYEDYQNFSFGRDKVVERQTRSQDAEQTNVQTIQQPVRLNAKGSAVVTIPGLSGFESARDITTQLEFTDSNGEAQNVTRTLKVFPSGLLTAVYSENSYSANKNMKFVAAVVDTAGKPVSGILPKFEVFETITYTHKTRMVGGFYSSESVTEVKRVNVPVTCAGVTNERGQVDCEAKAPASGTYIVQSIVTDKAGNESYGSESIYISGTNRAWFPSENNDRMDLIAQQKEVDIGKKAKFQVKMPFARATVLVTVEREGIVDAFTVNVNTQNPVIEVPIKAGYAPNIYVSALAVRGRVTGPELGETAIVDLGKPSFKLGLASVNVGWKPHALTVKVAPTKETFKPREEASVDVYITNASGQPVPNAEFAFAVVDEGLLDLAKNRTWDLLEAMMGRRGLYVQTSTAQMQVVGKRHYGLKAKPTGGDGGQAPTRELFDTLVHWNPRVFTGADGKATVKFKMKDSLTKFRVVAVAQYGVDKFGKGEGSITAQQDVSTIPSLSQVSRNGDSAAAEFTVRNATKGAKTVRLTGRVKITMADGSVKWIELTAQDIALGALESKLASMGDVTMPDGAVKAEYEIVVSENGQQVDRIKVSQKVLPSVLVRTWMAQLNKVDRQFQPVGVELPATALPNQGGVKVSLLSSLANGLDTVKDTLEKYPFQSLEYLVSYAAASGNQEAWAAAVRRLPAHMDAEGLVMFHPTSISQMGSDILTAYILEVSKIAGLQIPEDIQSKMVEGLTMFVEGKSRLNREKQAPADEFIRRVNAIEALTHYGLAQAVWLSSLPKIIVEQIPTSTLIDLISIYANLADAPGGAAKSASYETALRGRLTRIGTGLKLNEDSLRPWYGMSSGDSDNAQLILVISSNKELAGRWQNEVPLLVNGTVQMMNRGAWDLTVANAYGVLAMKAYTQEFEPEKVTGLTNVQLSGISKPFNWDLAGNDRGGVLNFGFKAPGKYRVDVAHQGTGTPWSIVAVSAAVPITQKIENHIFVTKTISPVKAIYRVGDEVTITLKVKPQTEMSNVSLIDPIPAGAKIVGSGLDNDQGGGPQTGGWVWPDSQEISADSYRASYSSIPAAGFEVVYKVRLNNAGNFKLPATRVEAIYMPENFSETPNMQWKVRGAP